MGIVFPVSPLKHNPLKLNKLSDDSAEYSFLIGNDPIQWSIEYKANRKLFIDVFPNYLSAYWRSEIQALELLEIWNSIIDDKAIIELIEDGQLYPKSCVIFINERHIVEDIDDKVKLQYYLAKNSAEIEFVRLNGQHFDLWTDGNKIDAFDAKTGIISTLKDSRLLMRAFIKASHDVDDSWQIKNSRFLDERITETVNYEPPGLPARVTVSV